MMFQLDIFLMPRVTHGAGDQLVCAFMDLTYGDTKACITIAVTRLLLETISEQIGGGVQAPEIAQDIACEITNIVGNHLRSYLSDKMGVEFVISLPKPGYPPDEEPPHVFNLHFRIRENDSIDLDFRYAVSTEQVAVV
jgi:hypothetical protein